jgi:hypothetical protein
MRCCGEPRHRRRHPTPCRDPRRAAPAGAGAQPLRPLRADIQRTGPRARWRLSGFDRIIYSTAYWGAAAERNLSVRVDPKRCRARQCWGGGGGHQPQPARPAGGEVTDTRTGEVLATGMPEEAEQA